MFFPFCYAEVQLHMLKSFTQLEDLLTTYLIKLISQTLQNGSNSGRVWYYERILCAKIPITCDVKTSCNLKSDVLWFLRAVYVLQRSTLFWHCLLQSSIQHLSANFGLFYIKIKKHVITMGIFYYTLHFSKLWINIFIENLIILFIKFYINESITSF